MGEEAVTYPRRLSDELRLAQLIHEAAESFLGRDGEGADPYAIQHVAMFERLLRDFVEEARRYDRLIEQGRLDAESFFHVVARLQSLTSELFHHWYVVFTAPPWAAGFGRFCQDNKDLVVRITDFFRKCLRDRWFVDSLYDRIGADGQDNTVAVVEREVGVELNAFDRIAVFCYDGSLRLNNEFVRIMRDALALTDKSRHSPA